MYTLIVGRSASTGFFHAPQKWETSPDTRATDRHAMPQHSSPGDHRAGRLKSEA